MSALAVRGSPVGRMPFPSALGIGAATLGASAGVLFKSALLLAVVAGVVALWAVVALPEVLLVLLTTEGTLKSLPPFDRSPVDLLLVSAGLVAMACALG